MNQPFQFIPYAPHSKGEDLLSTHVARSHTAKVNRQRLAERQRLESSTSSQQPRNLRPGQQTSRIPPDFEFNGALFGSSVQVVEVFSSIDQGRGHVLLPQQNVPRGPSPIFGGHSAASFNVAESGPETAEIAHYVFNEVFPSCFSHEERAAWFMKFSDHPLVYHAFSYFRLFHQERVTGALSIQQRRNLLDESLKVFGMLNWKLDRINQEEIEPVLLAMTLMFKDRENLGKDHPSFNERLLFSPHMLQTELAGLDIGRVRQTDGYLPAVSMIAHRAGGLTALQDAGLARIICMSDLIAASMNFTPPFFPRGWDLDTSILVPGKYWHLPPSIETPGEGFRKILGGRLPKRATFVTLSIVNLAMAQNRDKALDGSDFKVLVAARNAAKHAVLCLPTWASLPEHDRVQASEIVYECCRLAAVLYANAVIFPTLEDFPGIQEPVRRLREQLEMCDFTQWEDDACAVFLWALFVGGIGSYRSKHWTFFVSTLRIYITRVSVLSFETINLILERFVWSEHACDEGASVLWKAAQSGRLT